MAGTVNDDCVAGRSSEGISSGQRCQSRDSLTEWRSSEQVENGIASTSPPYWDIDDDDDSGAKPSELFGKFTWKIEKFSEISKRELRSNAFEVGGYKWYILIYPQGCDVCNHLSLFLCVANHEKLLPGWSHFAQFTIAVVNKDPKKSKYSDTLHRFWKKEHDWGWKKFMELSKIIDGFIVSDTLVIKAQVQVIREKAHRPFRCLDCQYRRELVRVYLSNVEQICRRFVEERRGKLSKLIEDKVRWSSFRAFWLGVDQNARRCMSREKTDSILKVVVKHFFVEKEVTSTLVMDSLYSGLKALECQSKNKKERAKLVEMEEMPVPIVCVEEDTFVLADDILVLLERAALEPLPPKDEKGPQSQNRTKDVSCGEDFNKDSIERDERRLTEMGRRTVEIFVLAHIYSNRIEVAYQEAVALQRQEELIREEEAAAGQAESEIKAKRGVTEKEKRTKKKQAKQTKQKRSSRKGKDRGRDEKSELMGQEKHLQESPSGKRMFDGFSVNQTQSIVEKPEMPEDVSGMSDDGEDVSETLRPDLGERDMGRVHWDTDMSEINPSTDASSSGMSCLPIQKGGSERKNLSFMDDSSSTCSTDSVPFVVVNGPSKGNSLQNKCQKSSPSRGKSQRSRNTRDRASRSHDTDNQPLDPATDAGGLCDATGSGREDGPESEAVVLSLKDRIQWLEQHLVKKEEEVVTLQKKLNVKDQVDQVDVNRPSKQMTAEASCSSSSPTGNAPSASQPKQAAANTATAEPIPVREASSNGPSRTEKTIPLVTRSPQMSSVSRPDAQKVTALAKAACTPTMVERPAATQQASVMSRPLSAPLVPAPRPNAPVISSTVQTAPFLSRSVSAAGRLGTDPFSASHVYVPQSYRNAITGKTIAASSTSLSPRPSLSSLGPSPAHSQPPSSSATLPMLSPQNSARNDQSSVRSGIGFGSAMSEVPHSQPQWTSRSHQETKSMPSEQYLLNNIQRLGIYGATSDRSRTFYADEVPVGVSARQSQGASPDEFPHLDIINSLFDDDQHVVGKAGKANGVFPSPHNGHHHPLSRQFTLPNDVGAVDVGPSINSSRFDRSARYPDDGIRRAYSSSSVPYDGLRDVVPQSGLPGYLNGQIDGMIPSQWPGNGTDLSLLGMRNVEGDGFPYQLPDYSNLAGGVNGYTMFRPANGH